MPNMINFGVYIWPKSMLGVTPGKNCSIIKSMSSIIEFISLKNESEYDQEIPQSKTADNPVAP